MVLVVGQVWRVERRVVENYVHLVVTCVEGRGLYIAGTDLDFLDLSVLGDHGYELGFAASLYLNIDVLSHSGLGEL